MKNSEWYTIFYSPHQDDEAIAFAGAIAEHKEAGRPIILVLITNGISQNLFDLMNGCHEKGGEPYYCQWHKEYHNFNLTHEQIMWARRIEFIESARELGVDNVYILEDGQGIDDGEPYGNYDAFVKKIEGVIQRFEDKHPNASHKLISGRHEQYPNGYQNETHKACWDAAKHLFQQEKITDFTFYRCYEYVFPEVERNTQIRRKLKSEWKKKKQNALDQYKKFEPAHGRYALGYHDVKELIDNAYNDDYEYVDFLTSKDKIT